MVLILGASWRLRPSSIRHPSFKLWSAASVSSLLIVHFDFVSLETEKWIGRFNPVSIPQLMIVVIHDWCSFLVLSVLVLRFLGNFLFSYLFRSVCWIFVHSNRHFSPFISVLQSSLLRDHQFSYLPYLIFSLNGLLAFVHMSLPQSSHHRPLPCSALLCDPHPFGHPELLGRHFFDSSCSCPGTHEHKYGTSPDFLVLRFDNHLDCLEFNVSRLMLVAEYDRITHLNCGTCRHRDTSARLWLDCFDIFESVYGSDLIPEDVRQGWATCMYLVDRDCDSRYRVELPDASNVGSPKRLPIELLPQCVDLSDPPVMVPLATYVHNSGLACLSPRTPKSKVDQSSSPLTKKLKVDRPSPSVTK